MCLEKATVQILDSFELFYQSEPNSRTSGVRFLPPASILRGLLENGFNISVMVEIDCAHVHIKVKQGKTFQFSLFLRTSAAQSAFILVHNCFLRSCYWSGTWTLESMLGSNLMNRVGMWLTDTNIAHKLPAIISHMLLLLRRFKLKMTSQRALRPQWHSIWKDRESQLWIRWNTSYFETTRSIPDPSKY